MKFSHLLRLFCTFLFFCSFARAEEERLELLDIFRFVPQTASLTFKTSFSKEAIPAWIGIAATTGVLIYYDEKLLLSVQQAGRASGVGNYDNTKPVVKAYGYNLIRLPTDTGSALYFLGDGWMHMGIAGGFLATGYIAKQNYEVNTGIMLVHGMLVSTIFNQALKRSFGRESPNGRTHEGGNWRPFPSFKNYGTDTGHYDAMPSGHVMTATLTFTVLAERYTQHRTLLYSIGGVWVTALGLEMMNNGVHWASDYPLGIAMGWVVGKMAVKMTKPKKTESGKEETAWMLYPSVSNGVPVLNAFAQF